MTREITSFLLDFNQEHLIIAIGLLGITFLTFFVSLLSMPAQLFFASDIERVLPLPLKPFEIVVARVLSAMSIQYIFSLFVLAILYAGYTSVVGFDGLFFLRYIGVSLWLPLIPTLAMVVLSILVVNFSNFLQTQDQYNKLMIIVSLIFLGGYYYFLGTAASPNSDFLQYIVEGSNSLVAAIVKFVPYLQLFFDFLFDSNILSFFLSAVLHLVVIYISFLVASKYYLSGALKTNNFAAKKVELSKANFNKKIKIKSVYFNTVSRDVKELFRSPIYLMNCLFSPIIMVAAIVFVSGFSFLNASGESIDIIFYGLSTLEIKNVFIIILLSVTGVSLFASFSMSSSCTAITREGSQFEILKSYPIPVEKQLLGKTFPNLVLISILSFFVTGLGCYIFYSAFHDVTMTLILFISSFILNEIVIIFSCFFTIGIDALFPKLDWSSEQEAVKQNFYVMISFGLGFALLFAGFGFMMAPIFTLGIKAVMIVLLYLLLLPLSWLFYKYSIRRLCRRDL
ncbi:MAG: hypothetical protein ACK5KR_04595 [Breznakia sp.]